MKQYIDSLKNILENGNKRGDRTGTGVISIFGGTDYRFDLREGFPATTTKKLAFKSVIAELLWFLSGSANINDLKEIYPKCKIWDANYDAYNSQFDLDLQGHCGHIYGRAWRAFGNNGRDQIKDLISGIITNPEGRRHIVTAWHPSLVGREQVALPPCHMFFQCYVEGEYLDLLMYQRSCDMVLGVPFNIASYSALMYILGHLTYLKPRFFIHKLGDAHIYLNHIDQVKEQISREPKPLPTLIMKDRGQTRVEDFKLNDFSLDNYEHHGTIKAEMAV